MPGYFDSVIFCEVWKVSFAMLIVERHSLSSFP